MSAVTCDEVRRVLVTLAIAEAVKARAAQLVAIDRAGELDEILYLLADVDLYVRRRRRRRARAARRIGR